jgi:hypothetical protein
MASRGIALRKPAGQPGWCLTSLHILRLLVAKLRPGADLTEAQLFSANLSAATLLNANLSRAELRGAGLSDADLTSADLTGAKLIRVNLFHADLIAFPLSPATRPAIQRAVVKAPIRVSNCWKCEPAQPGFRIASVSMIVCAGLLCGAMASAVMADPIQIVRDGLPLAVIVLKPGAHALENEAAEDLRWAVREATGAALEIVSEVPTNRTLRPICIAAAASLPSNAPYDGGEVRSEGDGVVIAGATAAGVANAVATILLEDFGVRMYYPEAQFTIVPTAKSLRIRPRTVVPQFAYRLWSGLVGREAAAYTRRNRLSDARVPIRHHGFGHNLASIISVAKHAQEHPEYFALRNGVRDVRGKDAGDTAQPCFTNPDVVRFSIEAARRYFDENPVQDTFPLCVNDNSRYCQCHQCAALDQPYRNLPVGRQYSESYFDYVAKVAEAVEQTHPGRYLGVFAYWNVEQPPRNRTRLPDNVLVALTLDILQHYDPAYRDKDRELIRAWNGYAKNLHTYVYYGLGWYTPRMSPRLVAEDLRFAAQNGVRAIYCEAYPFWAWCGPMHYVASRLQWDAKADVDRVLDEFHRDCFGDVAGAMRAFHEACERYWTRPRKGKWFEGLDRLSPEEAMADTAILGEARTQLEKALAQTQDPLVRSRIAWLKKGFDFTTAVAEGFDAKKTLADANGALERLLRAAGAVETAHDALVSEPAYLHCYYEPGTRFDGKCWGWFKTPLRTAAEARWTDLHSSLPAAEADAKWQKLASESGLTPWLERRHWEFHFDPSGGK